MAYRPNNISPNPRPRMMDMMNEAFCVLFFFIGIRIPTQSRNTHMTMSIRVKCTDCVPSEAIPRGISYLGTKGGSDDKIALSSLGGALATLQRQDQLKARPNLASMLTSCSNMHS